MKRSAYIFIFLMMACATVKSPTGGEKDIIPPKVIAMSPGNYSTNFKGDRIVMEFDEYVKLNDFSNQLLVSPPLNKQPEFNIRGRQVIIELKETLRDSTTYTFNLGEGIVDNNEGNVLDSNVVVFSTGPFLDSLELRGKVMGAYSAKPKVVSVMLYSSFEDSVIIKEKPTYFTKTNENGDFVFSNLRAGNYKLVAMMDENKNYKWELTERLAFSDSLVTVVAQDSVLNLLYLFKDPPKKQYVREYTATKNGKSELKMNVPVDSMSVEALGFEYEELFTITNQKRDSLVYWFKNINPLAGCFLKLSAGDWTDTLAVYNFEVPENPKEKPRVVTSKEIQIVDKPVTITFNRPITEFDTTRVFISNRIDTLPLKLEQTDPLTLQGDFSWKEGTAHQLIAYPGFVTDLYGMTNDTILDLRNVKMANFFSELLLSVVLPSDGNFILNLEDEDGKIERTVSGSSDFDLEWKGIPAGNYILRLIHDQNGNGKWDTGDYFAGKQPERVYVLYDLPKLRSNWVLEQTWNVGDQPN